MRLEIRGAPAGRPIGLSSFIQGEALRLEPPAARQDDVSLGVEVTRDEAGFARFVIAPPPRGGTITVTWEARPGAAEEAAMSGPTGYRFGHLDRTFGLFGARQIFLLPMDSGLSGRIEVRFLLPGGMTIVAPWDRLPEEFCGPPGAAGGSPCFVIAGDDPAARLVRATLGAGDFETAAAGPLRVHVLKQLPDAARREAMRRALALEEFLAARLGRAGRAFDLILVPKAPDGMLISVAQGPDGFGLSLGDGLPVRWLSIGRALARAHLDADPGAARLPDAFRWISEALPTWLSIGFSDADGARPRQAWLERLYFEAAAPTIDLTRPGDLADAPDPLIREWRGALVLDLLSLDMSRRGEEDLDEILRRAAARGGPPDLADLVRNLSPGTRTALDGWLRAAPYPFPFPGAAAETKPIHLTAARLPSASAGKAPAHAGRRVDLYLGGRNLGLLEQCGCRSRQAGGLARRATLLRSRLRPGTAALAIELGDAIAFDQHSFPLDTQKIADSDLALALVVYSGGSASVVSHAELSYGPAFLAGRVERLPRGFRLLSANVSAPGVDLDPFLEMRRGGVLLRIIGVEDPSSYHLGRALEFEDAVAGIPIEDPAEAVARVLRGRAAGALSIVAGPIGPSALLKMHRLLPALPVIVTDDYFEITQDPRLVFDRPMGTSLSTFGFLGETLVVLLQTDSYALARLGLYLNAAGRITAAEIEDLILDEAIPDDVAARRRIDAHYARLAALSGLAAPPPLGGRLRERLAADYTGAAVCAVCHAAEDAQWRTTPHATAFATLLAKRRQGVPGCHACHVTGYGQPTGYKTAADHALRDVQCEACHGPGARHARDPRPGGIVRVPPAAVCLECHTETHSEMNEGNFEDYLARVTHAPGAAAPPGL